MCGDIDWRNDFNLGGFSSFLISDIIDVSFFDSYLTQRTATEVDTACGAILEELRRQDALDNTVIIFTTDNGNYHSEHGLADKW